MSQPSRKRQHQQSPPPVKEEPQDQEEDPHSIGAGINASQSQCPSSSNCENSNNTNGTAAAGGNGAGNDINELKLKMAAIEAKNQILEGKLENQELRGRLNATSEGNILANLKQENRALWMRLKEVEENAQKNDKKIIEMKDEFGKKLTALEAKHQQEIAGLKAIIERNQPQQQPTARMSDCVVVNMQESKQGTSNNSNEIQHRIVDIRKQATMAATAALIPPPLKPTAAAPNPVPYHSVQQQQEEGEVLDEDEPKRLCNPLGNGWNPHTSKATMKITLPDQLTVHNSSPNKWWYIVARKGFLITECRQLLQKHFSGPILYYYEITTKSPLVSGEGRLSIGFSNGTIKEGSWIGGMPNTYAMPEKHHYCLLSGKKHLFQWPLRASKPIWTGCEDVFGCGLVLSADNKLAIFFTTNGTLMGKQIPIAHTCSILYPSVNLNSAVSVEANFGQKPFKYNIDQCPGLQLQW